MKVSEWQEVQDWYRRVASMQETTDFHTLPNSKDTSASSAFKLKYDINHIKSLSAFDAGDLAECRDFLDQQTESRGGVTRDPEVFPLWDPSQLLKTSHQLLLKAITIQAGGGEEGSLSDDESVTSEGDYGAK